ncbi:MAG: peptidoglycan DD-metalloendopeptidase family protein [Gammaproteobacteria bacterium]
MKNILEHPRLNPPPCGGRKQLCFFILLLLTSCAGDNPHPAPIVNGWHLPTGQRSHYVVQQNDTLYSIAWAFDMDFRDLARINHLSPPYAIKVGRVLYMASAASSQRAHSVKTRAMPNVTFRPVLAEQSAKQPASEVVKAPSGVEHNVLVTGWHWPAQGRVVQGFRPIPGGNKGINIAGKLGEPVIAAASGKIVYCGASLPGYGNLIIIKHNDQYLSAYANNKLMLVKEGQVVKAGQVIAQMGTGRSGQAELHFEVRLNGKPVAPLSLLKSSKQDGLLKIAS